jgi:conjugative relaxase-like TrwC/TraI family protein
MLSLHSLKSASEAGKYYQQDNYYASGDTARQTSQWYGKGAAILGLSGHVKEEDFKQILAGNLPDGSRLGRMQGGKRIHRPGLDMTFSAPKSISILAEIGGDERLLKAHEKAVNHVLDYVEKNHSYTRIKGEDGKVVKEKVDNLIIAKFQHDVSRLQDPQLHTHCVVANATKREDGNWRSLEMADVFHNKMMLGAMYRSTLAKQVKQMGYTITRTDKDCMFEVEEVPGEVKQNFSKRREDIKEMLGNFREQGGKAASVAALITRSRKQSLSQEDKTELWQKQSDLLNFDAKAIVAKAREKEKQAQAVAEPTEAKPEGINFDMAKLDTQAPEGSSIANNTDGEVTIASEVLKELGVKEFEGEIEGKEEKMDLLSLAVHKLKALWQQGNKVVHNIYPTLSRVLLGEEPTHNLNGLTLAIEHLSERNSRFTFNEIVRTAADLSLGDKDMFDIHASITERLEKGELLAGDVEGEGFYYTTPELKSIEEESIAMLKNSKNACRSIMSKKEIAAGLAASPVGERANEGQQACIVLALNSKDRVIGVQGHAGVGKTFMMKEAKRLMDNKGWEFIGMAPSASAARTLQNDAGIDSQTISRFLAVHDNFINGGKAIEEVQREMAGKVLLVDEASLASSKQVHGLLKFSALTGTKLILMGDTKQLGAVEAGRPFQQLQENGMATAEMTDIIRQKCPKIREAVYQVISGIDRIDSKPFEKAVDTLDKSINESQDILEDTIKAWRELPEARRDETLLVAPSNKLRQGINTGIRNILVEEGKIKKGGINFTAYENRSLTVAQLKYYRSYTPGNVIMFAKGYKRHGISAQEGLKVVKVNEKQRTITFKNEKGREFTLDPGRIPQKTLEEAGLYQDLPLKLAEGDKLRWTRNSKKDPEIINGYRMTVVAVNADKVMIKQQDGKIKEVDIKHPDLKHIDYAFSSTVHSAQGLTKSETMISLDANHKNLTNQRMIYVAISRAKDQLHIITQDKKALATSLGSNTGSKAASLDIKHKEMSL